MKKNLLFALVAGLTTLFSVAAPAETGTADYAREQRRPPVLDLYGDNDLPQVLASAGKRKQSLAARVSRQVMIGRADQFFTGHEAEMVAVADFPDTTLK